ncbi:MAG: DUF4465 domain-containing protein [Bacteroidia bacterium]|nr:DUF4465 domain-containing protein [Bacteroidia bacterium]
MKRFIYSILIGLLTISCENGEFEALAPEIFFKDKGQYEITLSDTLKLNPKITYDQGSTYTWRDGEEIVSDSICYVFVPKELKDYQLYFEVRNSRGSDIDTINIMVREYYDFSEFDNMKVNSSAKVLVMHPDSLQDDYFKMEGHKLAYHYIADTLLWGGYAYSSRISSTSSTQSYGCAYTATQPSKSQYMVVNDMYVEPDIIFKEKYLPRSIEVANDECSVYLSKFGSEELNYTEFRQGDYMKVKIYGIIDAETGRCTQNSVEYKMIDCDFDGPAKYYRLNEWQSLDLRELGEVEGLRIKIESTVTQYPMLCCIDNLRLQKE